MLSGVSSFLATLHCSSSVLLSFLSMSSSLPMAAQQLLYLFEVIEYSGGK